MIFETQDRRQYPRKWLPYGRWVESEYQSGPDRWITFSALEWITFKALQTLGVHPLQCHHHALSRTPRPQGVMLGARIWSAPAYLATLQPS